MIRYKKGGAITDCCAVSGITEFPQGGLSATTVSSLKEAVARAIIRTSEDNKSLLVASLMAEQDECGPILEELGFIKGPTAVRVSSEYSAHVTIYQIAVNPLDKEALEAFIYEEVDGLTMRKSLVRFLSETIGLLPRVVYIFKTLQETREWSPEPINNLDDIPYYRTTEGAADAGYWSRINSGYLDYAANLN